MIAPGTFIAVYRKAANRTGNRKPNWNLRKPNRLRLTKKPEKPETEETETAVCKKWYLCTDLKWPKLNRAEVLVPPSEGAPRDLQNEHGFSALLFQGV